MQSNALGYYCNWTVLDFYALSCLHFNSHWLISCNKVEPSLLCWWSREGNHRTWWHLGLSCLCTAGLLQSSSEILFNEIWNACWLYIDMWGNVWAKAAVTNPQVLSTAYKPNMGIPRFISLTFCMILWGWNQRKSTTSEAPSLTAELQIPWGQQCPEISPILGAPEKVKENGTSTNGILASREWYGINEKGGKKIQWVQTAVEVLKLWLYLLDWGNSETMEDDSEFPSALVCLPALFLMTHTHWWTPLQQAVSYSKEGPCWVWPSHAFLPFILWIGGQSTKELEHCKLTWSQRICGFPDFICVPEVFQMAFCIQV